MEDRLGAGKMRGVGVGGTVIEHRHAPVEARREVHHRHGVRTCPEDEHPRGQGERDGEQREGTAVGVQPAALARRGGLLKPLADRAVAQRGRGEAVRVVQERQASHRHVRLRRLGHHADDGRQVGGERLGEAGERLPVIRRPHRQEEDAHRALAPKTQPPQELIRPLQVVLHRVRLPVADHRQGVLAQVALQTPPGDEAGVVAVGGHQYECAGLAVGGALGMHEDTERKRAPRAALAFKQGQQGS